MKDLNLATYEVAELNEVEMMKIDGGVFSIVIWGITITAEMAAKAVVGAFCAGAAAGVALYCSK